MGHPVVQKRKDATVYLKGASAIPGVASFGKSAVFGQGVVGRFAFNAPTARIEIHEPLPQDHPVYALVGRVASEWSHFEGVLDLIIWGLAGLSGPIGACITAQMMGAGNRLVTVQSLAQERGIFPKISRQLESLSQRSKNPQDERNRAVHDPWFWEKNSRTLAQHRSKPKKEPVFGFVPIDVQKLEKLIVDITDLRSRAMSLREKINELSR